ncbi:UNVERIFIED_CONTAM: hypothetical protein Sindi_2116100, partial [Sesamum indicum]
LWDELGRIIWQEKPFARAYCWNIELTWNDLKLFFGEIVHKPNHSSNDKLYAERVPRLDETIVTMSSNGNGTSSEDSVINFVD